MRKVVGLFMWIPAFPPSHKATVGRSAGMTVGIVGMISFFLFIVPGQVTAANSSMGFSPQAGAYDKAFTVDLVIDGKGERFNAGQATVAVSENLLIKDLKLGDCNFSFFRTPSVQDPSFKGVILGTYKNKCTVYTMTVGSLAKGKASLAIQDALVKRYGDAAEILGSMQNGNYSLTAVTDTKSVLGAQMTPKDGLYTVNITVVSKDTKAVEGAVVSIRSVEKKDEKKVTTDTHGVANFKKVTTGVYTVVVEKNGKKLGEQIINVSGPQYTLNFSITAEDQKNILLTNPLFQIVGLVILGMLVGSVISVLIGKFRRR